MINYKRQVITGVEYNNETELTNVKILFPSNQPSIGIEESTMILAEGIMLLIKSCDNNDLGMTSYELMTKIMNRMNETYGSTTDLSNASADVKLLIKEPKQR